MMRNRIRISINTHSMLSIVTIGVVHKAMNIQTAVIEVDNLHGSLTQL